MDIVFKFGSVFEVEGEDFFVMEVFVGVEGCFIFFCDSLVLRVYIV